MAHLRSQAKGGYYPLPEQHLPAITSLIAPQKSGGRILDPCAGEGAALQHLAEAWHLTPYANELDHERSAACRELFGMENVVQGDLMTLRTPNSAYSVVYVNPPYTENKGGASEKRREFEHLAHSFKWVQVGGLVLWVVYAHHMTQRAAEFLCKHSSSVDVYRLPGLHLDSYPQILVVARAKQQERGEVVDTQAMQLVEACQSPDTLSVLEVHDNPKYKLPAPTQVKPFYFRPDEITAEVMLPMLEAHGVHTLNQFQQVLDVAPPEPELQPIVPPRSGQLGMILAAGLFNGLLLKLEEGEAAVRGSVRMVEIDTTPEDLRGVRETIEHRAQVTITLLHRSGQVTCIEGKDKDRLVAFIQRHKSAFLDYLTTHTQPLYDFDHSQYASVFERVFRNRKLPGRPVTGLFETQKHVVAALLAALKKRRKAILVGDMGCGKTPMAATVVGVLWNEGKFKSGQVAVVMAPPHLIEKWARELSDVIPGCVPHIADKDLGKGHTLVDDVTAFMQQAEDSPDKLHILIVSRERAKLGEGWEAAYTVRKERFAQWAKDTPIPQQFLNKEGELRNGVKRIVTEEVPICPTCSTTINSAKDGNGKTDPLRWMEQKPRQCHHCGGALWQLKRTFSAPDEEDKFPKRNPRYPVARLLRERFADRVAVVICDELHENKSIASDQGRAMQDLVMVADYAIGLTGTLFGGVASSVFWLEWAFNHRMPHHYPLDDGIENAINRWVRTMGVMVKVVEYKQDVQSGTYNGTDRHEHRPQEAPGISPLLIRELLDHCIWVGLPDLAFALPEYKEIPVPVKLPAEIQTHYDQQKSKLLDYLMGCREEGDASFLGAYLHACLRWPSTCYEAKPVIHRTKFKDEAGNQVERLVVTMKGFGEERIYPKEQSLLDLLKDELAAGRPCVVFVAQSGKYRIQDRLIDLIKQHVPDAKPAVLESNTVATDKRDSWVKKQVKAEANILICNPRLIETGMDVLWAKSLIFYETSYSLYTTAQASRRHWRVGQTDECRVYHMFYENTMEAQAIKLVSEKQAAAALLGGDADGGGLAQLSGGSTSLEAELAKSIADDAAVVDASSLFQQSARASADFTSGWATGDESESSGVEVIPLHNLVGKRFYHNQQAHEVVDYGPLTEASYRVKNLVTGDTTLMIAEQVEAAKRIAHDLPLSIERKPSKPKVIGQKALPQVPTLTSYHASKRQHPKAVALVEHDGYFYAYAEDAERVATVINSVVDKRGVAGQSVAHTAVPVKDIDLYVGRLTKAGLRVAVLRKKTTKAPQPDHALPATLHAAFSRYQQEQDKQRLTFIELPSEFVTFGPDAEEAARLMRSPAGVHAVKGGPSVPRFAFKKARQTNTLKVLTDAGQTVALVNGTTEIHEPKPKSKQAVKVPAEQEASAVQQIALF